MTEQQYKDLIARGCAKVNISTAVKIKFMQANLEFLRAAEAKNKWDPPSLFGPVRNEVKEMTKGYIHTFGSEGKAW